MADTQVLEACAVRRRGSSPLSRTSVQQSESSRMSQTITQPDNTRITLEKSADNRDSYANSVQVRLSIWDFLLVFGTLEQETPEQVRVNNFQGVYLSPQQAKALANVLNHNLAQYEQSFGTISLEGPGVQRFAVPSNGPVH